MGPMADDLMSIDSTLSWQGEGKRIYSVGNLTATQPFATRGASASGGGVLPLPPPSNIMIDVENATSVVPNQHQQPSPSLEKYGRVPSGGDLLLREYPNDTIGSWGASPNTSSGPPPPPIPPPSSSPQSRSPAQRPSAFRPWRASHNN